MPRCRAVKSRRGAVATAGPGLLGELFLDPGKDVALAVDNAAAEPG